MATSTENSAVGLSPQYDYSSADFATIACHAAVEFDKHLNRAANKAEAINLLARIIRLSADHQRKADGSQVQPAQEMDVRHARADKLIFNRAIIETSIRPQSKRVAELEKVLEELSEVLLATSVAIERANTTNRNELIKLRDFCLALSRQAIADQPSVHELESDALPVEC